MKEKVKFKVGDLVYSPKYTNKIITLEHRYDEQEFYTLQFVYDETSVATLANNGIENLGSDLTPIIFHATQEKYELLSKLYPNVTFEPPPKRKEPKEIIKAILKSGWECVPCYVTDSKISSRDFIIDIDCDDDAVGRSVWSKAIPFDPKTGKTIIDFVDGEVVLESENE